MARVPMTSEQHRDLIQLIARHGVNALARQNLLEMAGLGEFLLRISPDTEPQVFAQQAVRVWQDYGTLQATGKPALVNLLVELRDRVQGDETAAALINALLAPFEGQLLDQIRVLLMAANPLKTTALRLDVEVRTIKERLREAPQHECIDNVRVVVLNACWSETQACAITEHIDVVIGMNAPIDDDAAIHFAAGFYRGIGFGRSIARMAFRARATNASSSCSRSLGMAHLVFSRVFSLPSSRTNLKCTRNIACASGIDVPQRIDHNCSSYPVTATGFCMMKCYRCLISFFLTISALGTAAIAFAQTTITATPLALPRDASKRVFPSPDGRQVAYARSVRVNGHSDHFVCVSDATAPGEPTCVAPPEQLPTGFEPAPLSLFIPLSWSPDGTRLAVSSQPLASAQDTDLYVLDIATQTWQALAQDKYEGTLAAAPAGTIIDAQPAWSPDGNAIVVERSAIGANGRPGKAAITRLDARTGEATTVGAVPGGENLETDAGSVAGMAWSPDGKHIAVCVRHQHFDETSDGMWLFGVDGSGSRQLVNAATIIEAFKSVYPAVTPDALGPVFWSPDGRQVLFWAGTSKGTPALNWPMWASVATGQITVLDLPRLAADTDDKRAIRPLQAAWRPDSQSLLVFALGMNPDAPVTPLNTDGTRPRTSVFRAEADSGTATLLGNLPQSTTIPLYYAMVGKGGDAILGGYHLKME